MADKVAPKLTPCEWEGTVGAAFAALAASPGDPRPAAAAFEPVLADVFFHRDAARTAELRRRAGLAFPGMGGGGPVSLEVRHLGWHLQHVGETGFDSSSVIDLLVMCRLRFDYRRHVRRGCHLCVEFPADEWVTRSPARTPEA